MNGSDEQTAAKPTPYTQAPRASTTANCSRHLAVSSIAVGASLVTTSIAFNGVPALPEELVS